MSLERSSLSKNPGVLWRVGLLFLAFAMLASAGATAAPTGPDGQPSGGSTSQAVAPESSSSTAPYLVRLGESNLMLAADSSEGDMAARAWQVRHDEVAAALEQLAANGLAGAYTYEEAARAFRAELGDSAKVSLAANPHVASVELWSEAALASAATEPEGALPNWQPGGIGTQAVTGVSSVAFVQVNSPFMWGRVNVGGLWVRLLLYDGDTVIAGATQITDPGTAQGQRCNAGKTQDEIDAVKDAIKIDPGQLYFETVFKSCDSNDIVMIRPGNRVRVMTIGDNFATPGDDPDEDKYVTVDSIEAWTRYERDTVSGKVPANANVVVTVTTSTLDLGSGYITPGSAVTYRELTADGSGNFAASDFRTTANPTLKTVNMDQGSRGFVRVLHANGDEVYGVHGQNALVLENSAIVHGYAYLLPSAPTGLVTTPKITVTRPPTTVDVAVTGSGGEVTASTTPDFNGRYTAIMGRDIVGGDAVTVSINGAPGYQMVTVPVTATVDVANNQIKGNAKPNTGVIVGVGRVTGYVTKNTAFTYVQHRVDANAAGAYATGQIQCGTSNYLNLGPGSFGYTGYEDPRGNFIYMAFAAQANYVMIDYPLVEGWVANGLVRPAITVRGAANQVKHQAVETPMVVYLTNQKIYLNTYYVHFTTAYVAAGDKVQVNTGTTVEIPVPSQGLTGFMNDESEVISGQGPPGGAIRVIPAGDKAARKDTVVGGNGRYLAENPYTSLNLSNCGESSKTKDFTQGDSGRVYLRYPNGNEVFAFFGRAMSVNENENRVEIWIAPLRGIDWTTTPSRLTTVALTSKETGITTSSSKTLSSFDRTIEIKDAGGNRVLIRAGDNILVTFDEGPAGLTRQASMEYNNIPLLTASADTDTSTVAGVGPVGLLGRAWTTSPVTSKASPIPARNVPAYSPVSFQTSSYKPTPITLVYGYSGKVSFSDDYSRKVWVAWAVPAQPVKITPPLWNGATVVCGKAPPNSPVHIYEIQYDEETQTTELVLIGTGTSDSQGKFCVTVSPALKRGQWVMAESGGSYSQPVPVTTPVFLPLVHR